MKLRMTEHVTEQLSNLQPEASSKNSSMIISGVTEASSVILSLLTGSVVLFLAQCFQPQIVARGSVANYLTLL